MIFGKWVPERYTGKPSYELEELGIFTHIDDESGDCIGVSFDITDDETWGSYKQRVAKRLTDAGIQTDPEDVDIICGTEYN